MLFQGPVWNWGHHKVPLLVYNHWWNVNHWWNPWIKHNFLKFEQSHEIYFKADAFRIGGGEHTRALFFLLLFFFLFLSWVNLRLFGIFQLRKKFTYLAENVGSMFHSLELQIGASGRIAINLYNISLILEQVSTGWRTVWLYWYEGNLSAHRKLALNRMTWVEHSLWPVNFLHARSLLCI